METNGCHRGVIANPADVGGDVSGAAIAIAAIGGQLTSQTCCQRHGGRRDGESTCIDSGIGDGDRQGSVLPIQATDNGRSTRGNGSDQTRLTNCCYGRITAAPLDVGGDIGT
ncbi:hypothetical protein D3C78_1528710 [compost metagenome]